MFGIKTWLHALPCVSRPMRERDLSSDPYEQLGLWMAKARKAGLPETNAMVVCTVAENGQPSQRVVLLKHHSRERGLVFYTNYGSRKARELEAHPQTALLFHYHILQRQIRITGRAERTTREESEAYFRTRPRGSQLGAWTSRQSEELDSRETFEKRFESMTERFRDQEVPCPEFWGGFRVIPETFEFWQGRAYRLHDRIVYRDQAEDGTWKRVRLYP